MDEIITEFISETRDMLQHVSGELIAWERDSEKRGEQGGSGRHDGPGGA